MKIILLVFTAYSGDLYGRRQEFNTLAECKREKARIMRVYDQIQGKKTIWANCVEGGDGGKKRPGETLRTK